MTREEMLLLTQLKWLCGEAPAFALAFPDNQLPLADELGFGFRLLDIAYGILTHAQERELPDGGSRRTRRDATAELKRQLRAQRGVVIDHDPRDQLPSTGQIVSGDPDCPES